MTWLARCVNRLYERQLAPALASVSGWVFAAAAHARAALVGEAGGAFDVGEIHGGKCWQDRLAAMLKADAAGDVLGGGFSRFLLCASAAELAHVCVAGDGPAGGAEFVGAAAQVGSAVLERAPDFRVRLGVAVR